MVPLAHHNCAQSNNGINDCEDPEDIPVNLAAVTDDKGKGLPDSDSAPMDLYFALIDGASRYQELQNGHKMAAIAEPPINASTGKPEKVAFAYANSRYRQAVVVLDLDMLSFSVTSGGRYDAYLWALFIATMRQHVKSLNWRLKVPPVLHSLQVRGEGGGEKHI